MFQHHRLTRLLSMLLLLSIVLSILPGNLLVQAVSEISSVEISGATAPVSGSAPDYHVSVPGSAQYAVESVSWIQQDTGSAMYPADTFEAGKQYQIRIILTVTADAVFKLDEIAELGFQIEVKKPPRNDGWSCSITFNGKDQAKFNADMCLFLENWADERKRRMYHKEEYEQWQKDTLAYYAANPVTEKPEPEPQIPSGYTYYEGEGLRKTKVEDLKREYYGLD